MKITYNLLSIISVAICVYSCSAPSDLVKTEELLPSDYSTYKTYAFTPTSDTSYTKMFDKKRLEKLMSAAAIRELNKKGMTLDTVHPDCFFTYRLIVNRNYEVDQQQEVVGRRLQNPARDRPPLLVAEGRRCSPRVIHHRDTTGRPVAGAKGISRAGASWARIWPSWVEWIRRNARPHPNPFPQERDWPP